MPRELKADGDVWKVRLGERTTGEGKRALLFVCVTTHQRPYRVVEVEADRLGDEADVEALSERELLELFRDSGSMGTTTHRAVAG